MTIYNRMYVKLWQKEVARTNLAEKRLVKEKQRLRAARHTIDNLLHVAYVWEVRFWMVSIYSVLATLGIVALIWGMYA